MYSKNTLIRYHVIKEKLTQKGDDIDEIKNDFCHDDYFNIGFNG